MIDREERPRNVSERAHFTIIIIISNGCVSYLLVCKNLFVARLTLVIVDIQQTKDEGTD